MKPPGFLDAAAAKRRYVGRAASVIPDFWTQHDIDALLSTGDIEDLVLIPIAITNLGTPDPAWSEAICLRLALHQDPGVRGNAILGLGHLARTTGTLDRERCLPAISAALRDAHPYVRGQASSAADDVAHILGWHIAR